MAIEPTDLQPYKSQLANDTSSNGGRMSADQVVSGAKNNMWPDVPRSERIAGSTKYRKMFFKVANGDGLTLLDAILFVESATPADDRVVIFPATQTDTQGDLTGGERLYGGGQLDVDVAIGATSVDVAVETAADDIFQDGDLIRISNQPTVDAATGTTELIRLASSNAVVWNGDLATLTFAAGQSLSNGYSATDTRVASCVEAGDIRATVDGWALSSVAGSYDGIVVVDAIGGVEQTWTLAFTSATAFTCTGDTLGSIGGGTTTSGDFTPNNTDYARPYFMLPASGWGGVWATNDLLVFTTHPAATAIWQKRIVPANCGSLSGNMVIISLYGESE